MRERVPAPDLSPRPTRWSRNARRQDRGTLSLCAVDYDDTDIAANYDRGRDHGPEFLNLWMTALASHTRDHPLSTILDLGCGTGRFSQALATHFDARVIGLDRSHTMLDRAAQKGHGPTVHYVFGSGEAIPLPDTSVDLVFVSMVFHHLPLQAGGLRHRCV